MLMPMDVGDSEPVDGLPVAAVRSTWHRTRAEARRYLRPGRQIRSGTVSGSPVVPIVELVGAGMSAIVQAIPITEEDSGHESHTGLYSTDEDRDLDT